MKSHTIQQQKFEKINAFIEEQMRRLSIPGAALAIVDGDQIVHYRGFGCASPGGEVPTAQTPFFIGSLTKSITALAILQQVEAGKMDLDAPVQHFLPWFSTADTQASAQITVHHLLNQTSGLPMSAGLTTLTHPDNRPDAIKRQAQELGKLALAHPVGAVCEYSNLNYDLLGWILETVSGEKYADYIHSHVFAPLKMEHSYTTKNAAKKNGLAVGYRYWFGIPIAAPDLPVPDGSLASGQLISCAEDMAHYLIAHLNGGRYEKEQILSEAGITVLHQGAAEYIKFGVSSGLYAMGWFVDAKGQETTLSHGGNVPEYSAYMGLIPGQKKGIVLLINADHYGLPPVLAEVGWGATALLAGQKPAPIRLAVIPWTMHLLALVPILQAVGVVATLLSARRWRRNPGSRPERARGWARHILLPLFPNLSLAAVPLFLLSRHMLGYLRLFMPDVFWTAIVSGSFAGVWSLLRTALVWQYLKPAKGSKNG